MFYVYRASVVHVVDGDTVDIDVHLGFDVTVRSRFRLAGIDAPESYGARASDEGRAAKQYLADTIPPGTAVVVRTIKNRREKYGRYLAEVYLMGEGGQPMDVSVNQQLVDAGHARPYTGGAR